MDDETRREEVSPGPVDVAVPEAEQAAAKTEVSPKGPGPFTRLFVYPKTGLFLLILTVTVLILGGAYYYSGLSPQLPVKQFTNVYSFVPEKISKSAPIRISLPEGVSKEAARAGISFSPEIAGSWQADEEEGRLTFRPGAPLTAGVYYAVNLDTGKVQMSGDFYVDEDPRIEAIFPAEDSEAHEDSEITIVFNRPMVPLSTLAVQEAAKLPITITPETPGHFKWVSTRNLQFVPETTLIPSSEYTVEVNEGLASIDGLPIAPVSHTFITRPLRYTFITGNDYDGPRSPQLGYRSPIVIGFNQPVDLERTQGNITVTRRDEAGAAVTVPVEVEYGETRRYDREAREYVSEEDKSKLFVYQREDRHGRDRLWDFETNYHLEIAGASPLVGTKDLTKGENTFLSVPDVIEDVSAQSDRSGQVRPQMMDPEGTITVRFYEEVDKDRSDFSVKGLREVTYGERCRTDESGEVVRVGGSCVKEPDQRSLIFSFDPNAFSTDESFTLELADIRTPDGLSVNVEPLTVQLRTYPSFTIHRTVPGSGTEAAPLDTLYVCSNTPLKDPGEAGLASYLDTEGYIVYGRWWDSHYLDRSSRNDRCRQGEFQTVLNYGLLPQTQYALHLSLTDEFGQQTATDLSFRTRAAEERYVRFHNMQPQYNVTPPERTTFTYAAENIEYVNLHICKMRPERFLELTADRPDRFSPPTSAGCSEVVTKRIDLPPRYFVNNYFQVDLAEHFADTRGHYVMTFGNPLYTGSQWNHDTRTSVRRPQYDRTYVSVTNLAVGKKEVRYSERVVDRQDEDERNSVLRSSLDAASNLYWVNNNRSLAAVSGARVTQYAGGERDEPFVAAGTATTDGDGIARVGVSDELVGAVVYSGGDTAVVTDWADVLGRAGYARDASRTYVYTDRPIYRPGHTVHIRGIDRVGFDGSYEVWDGGETTLQLFGADGTQLYETNVEVSQYGTFATDFELPLEAPLGTYRIEVLGQSSAFDVEEYVPAAFKLEATTDQEEYVNGDTMVLDVQADYYFGVPLEEGTVSYAVTAQDYHFDRYTDEYFRFGSGWYSCYRCGYGDDFLFRGETQIDGSGHARIERELDLTDFFDDPAEESSKLITVSLTAKDINGRSVSRQKSFILHKGEYYVGVKTDRYYTSVNDPVSLRVKTVDTEGEERSVRGLERTVYKVEWETFKRQEVDGGFYYRSEKRLDEVSQKTIRTDSSGNWEETITLPEEGRYEIHITGTDGEGNELKTTANLYIYGDRAVSVPPNNNYELELEVERPSVDVGDTASVLIKSPYENATVLITAERGTVYDYWIADVTGGLYLHEFPIKDEYAPNVYVSALLLSADPEVKYGNVRFDVGREQHELSVEVSSNKEHYLPGEEVILDVATADHTGRGVPAEVSLAVADLSVLALKGNPQKDPLIFFYDGFPLSVTTASNIKNILYEVDIPLGSKGGGGGDPEDLAKKKRGVFKDTAFWAADVETDENGRATVSFTLPDNLTTWQVESLGVTKDTKLGVDYGEFTTKKDLMAVPLKPRFVVPGDRFFLGAKVFNQTEDDARVAVNLESDTLHFLGEPEDTVSIDAGESRTVYFEVEAPEEQRGGEHLFTFTAATDAFIDEVEQGIAITPNDTYETVATANMTDRDRAREYVYVPEMVVAGKGGLTINANATLAVFLSDALTYMASYPYGCSEQLASALSTIGILKNALSLPNVEGEFETIEHNGVTYTVDAVIDDGLRQIYETQTGSGGFAYYKGLEPSLGLTLHVVTALADLQAAGVTIREEVLRRAAAYIAREAEREYRERPDRHRETVILAEYALRRLTPGEATPLTPLIEGLANDSAFLNEEISSMTLAYLSILTASEGYGRGISDRAYEALTNRIDIDGRGAYLTNPGNQSRFYYQTTIKNTALLLKAFAAQDDEHPAMGNVLRWLLAGRDDRGVWGSTHNTFTVVDAMVDYLTWQRETESRFTLKGLLGGEERFSFDFTPETIFDTFTHDVPMDELPREELVPVDLLRENRSSENDNLYYDMTFKYFLPVEELPPRDEGITITRDLYALDDAQEEAPLSEAAVGDVVRGKLTITVPDQYQQVTVADHIPAGFEIVNFNLATEDQSLQDERARGVGAAEGAGGLLASAIEAVRNVFQPASQGAQLFSSRDLGGSYDRRERTLRPTHVESHDDRVFLFIDDLSPGVYEYEYYLRALVPGEFQHLPAKAEQLYFPEVFGRTSGDIFTVTRE